MKLVRRDGADGEGTRGEARDALFQRIREIAARNPQLDGDALLEELEGLKETLMDPAARQALIDRYRDGPRAVRAALEGITENELDARSAPDAWTAREVAHHLADSEMTPAIRLRRLLAEDRPLIAGYDEQEFARRLHYERPIEASLDAMDAARRSTAAMLERLTDGEWAREGTHSESGRYTVEDWLAIYAAHAHDHAEQIRRARMAARR